MSTRDYDRANSSLVRSIIISLISRLTFGLLRLYLRERRAERLGGSLRDRRRLIATPNESDAESESGLENPIESVGED